jgi:hypothetical protein
MGIRSVPAGVGVYQSVLLYPRAVGQCCWSCLSCCSWPWGARSPCSARVPARGALLRRVIRSRPARILAFPAITTLALVGVPMMMYFTSWYTAVYHSTPLRELTYLVLMAPGYVFFWTLSELGHPSAQVSRGG